MKEGLTCDNDEQSKRYSYSSYLRTALLVRSVKKGKKERLFCIMYIELDSLGNQHHNQPDPGLPPCTPTMIDCFSNVYSCPLSPKAYAAVVQFGMLLV